MTIAQRILVKLGEDLLNFRVQYGYELDYPNIFKGYIPESKNNNYPLVCYDFETESSELSGSSNNSQLKTLQLTISIYLDEKKEKGKILDMREQARSDINKFIMNDSSITPNKTMKIDTICAMRWNVQTSHETNYEQGRCVLRAVINISYYEFYNNSLNYQSI